MSVTISTLGPGESWDIANTSANCLSVIQCRTSTATRYISGIAAFAPPTANSDINPNVQTSVKIGLFSELMPKPAAV